MVGVMRRKKSILPDVIEKFSATTRVASTDLDDHETSA
jgi:hypothetical protein